MIAIGIIVWAVLIIIMMELTSPGFILLAVALFAFFALLKFGIEYLIYRNKNKGK